MSASTRSIPPTKRPNKVAGLAALVSSVAALVAFGANWFVPWEAAGGLAIVIVMPLVVVAVLLVLTAFFWPRSDRFHAFLSLGACVLAISGLFTLLDHARSTSSTHPCASHLNHLGLAILFYAQSHDGQLPSSLGEAVLKEDLSPEALVCPATSDTVATGKKIALADELKQPGHCSYLYLGAGHKADDFGVADVLAYERETNHPEGLYVLFGDGHVEFHTREEFHERLKLTREQLTTRPTSAPTTRADRRE